MTNDITQHAQKLDVLATQLGYEGTLTVGALEDEIRFYQARTVEACLELGKRLILLKEMTPHGEFKQRIEMLNISIRTAQKFISAAYKFSKTDNLSVLKAAGNQSKLLELLVLDDEDIQELSEGGSVGDVTLDDIDRMTASELRKALREAKADNQAKDQLIQSKDRKINELDTELTKVNSPVEIAKRQENEKQLFAKKALEDLTAATLTMHNAVVRFTNDANSILDAVHQHELSDISEMIESTIVATFQQIAQTSMELGIQIDFAEMVNPAWMQTETDLPFIDSETADHETDEDA